MKEDFIGQIQVSQPNEKTRYIRTTLTYNLKDGGFNCINYMLINKDNTGINIYIETSGQNKYCGMNSGTWAYEEPGEEITKEEFFEAVNMVKKQFGIA